MTSVALFGAVPALRASGGVHHRRGWGGPSHGLVVIQIALSLVLLVAAGLLVRTVSHLAAVPLGFDRDEVLLITVETKGAPIARSRLALYERLVSAVSAVPGVEYAAASTSIPLSGGYGRLKQVPAQRLLMPRWLRCSITSRRTGLLRMARPYYQDGTLTKAIRRQRPR